MTLALILGWVALIVVSYEGAVYALNKTGIL